MACLPERLIRARPAALSTVFSWHRKPSKVLRPPSWQVSPLASAAAPIPPRRSTIQNPALHPSNPLALEPSEPESLCWPSCPTTSC